MPKREAVAGRQQKVGWLQQNGTPEGALAAEVNASADRMAAMLDRTLARIESVIDPALEARRRAEILSELEASGQRLDLTALAAARA